MHEYGRRSVESCRDWTEASYVLAELANEACWFHDAGCWSQYLSWDTKGLAVDELGYRCL
jgi:hypothetical protein